MRRNKEIEKLTEDAKGVAFPRFDAKLSAFRGRLRELVGENFGYSAGRELEYDEDSGVFFWSVSDYVGKLGDTSIKSKRTFEIDPVKSLSEEFERVVAEQKQYADEKLRASKAIIAAGGTWE